MSVNKNYFVNEGNRIGGQEPQGLGVAQSLVKASVAVTKGMVLEVTGNFTVGPASDGSLKVCGIAANDAAIDELVVIEAEGFVKLSASNAIIAAGDKVMAAGGGLVKKLPALVIDDATLAIANIALAADLGESYAQEASNLALNTGVNTAVNAMIAEINTEVVAAINGVASAAELMANGAACGICIAGCAANGNPYVKFTI